MAKKSKRAPARKQQAQQRPQRPHSAAPPPTSAEAAQQPAEELEDDYATGALPIPESDGPMPLPPPEVEAEEAPAPRVAASATATAERRRVGRVDPAQPRGGQQRVKPGRTGPTAAQFEPLPPEEPSIPFSRVPYVPADLRRVGIIAMLMVVLIVAADLVVTNLVK